MSPKGSPPPSNSISFLSLTRILWKSRFLILAVWLVVGAAAVVVIQKLPAIYAAETLILVDSQKIPEKYVSSTVSSDLQDRLATINQQILSSTRLKRIIEDLHLYEAERKTHVEEEVLEQMRKDIGVKLEKGWTGNRPGAFRIAYEGANPNVVAQVANRIANLYIEENLKTREVQAEGTAEFIETQLQESKKSLDETEAQIGAYRTQHNGELPQQEAMLVGGLNRLQVELQSSREALSQAQHSKVLLENSLALEESAAIAMTRVAESEVSRAATASEQPKVLKPSETLADQLQSLRSRGYTEQHPDIVRLKGDLARAKKAEEQSPAPKAGDPPPAAPETRKAALAPRDVVELGKSRDRIASLKVNRDLNAQEIERHKAEQQRIFRDMSSLQGRLERLPLRDQEMAKLTRDYEIMKANYRSLLDKKLAAGMATDLEHHQKSERFTVLDPARVPEKPIKPNRPLFNTAAIVMSLILGLAVGAGRELKSAVLLGEWELPAGVPVLARLPHMDMAPKLNSKEEEPAVSSAAV